MKSITLVTGNSGKLAEWQRLFPGDMQLLAVDIDLEEIQSLDMGVIIADKARRAYEQVGGPIIVEDIAAGLVRLNDLPGPFIKFFEAELGEDALFKLATKSGDAASVTCAAAYFDGNSLITVRGEITGTVVPARGSRGFGFDHCFVPAGSTKTFAEMTPAEKDSLSHRGKAVTELVRQLCELL